MSFRYYDPIIAFISENVSYHKREILDVRQKVAHELHLEGDILNNLLIKTGVISKKEPLTFKHE